MRKAFIFKNIAPTANHSKYVIYILILLCGIFLYLATQSNIYIYKGNSFKNHYDIPSLPILCSYKLIKYKCIYSRNKKYYYHASIYNGNKYFPPKPNFSYNIIITTEKLSQVPFMKNIGSGKNKYYHLAIDYRLISNKWHISKPQYSKEIYQNFINKANHHYHNLSEFMKRSNNVVYIQRVHYTNRQYLVREFMKYIAVDSYGQDLNNKKWPKNISRSGKIDILKKYKFCLAIENSVITWKSGSKYEAPEINSDYVTEKLLDCLIAGSIPIYFGPKNVNLFLPHPDAIINMSSFISIDILAAYILNIRNNTKCLSKYLQWHHKVSRSWIYRFKHQFKFDYCKICNNVKRYSQSNKN